MASFTAADDTLVLSIPDRGETIDIALSGTYSMQIDLEIEVGSKNSGSWQKIKTVSGAANATIADAYTSKSYSERIRLRVIVDTSGTCVATLTDNDDRSIHVIKDQVGNTLATFNQSGLVLPADLDIGGGVKRRAAKMVTTSAAITLTQALHAGKILTMTGTTGRAITLPEATGTGDVYEIFYVATVASGSHTIVAPSSATDFVGGVAIATDIAGVTCICNSGDDTITMNGSTTGGVAGTFLRFTDVVDGTYLVEGFLTSTSTEADPFSAAV